MRAALFVCAFIATLAGGGLAVAQSMSVEAAALLEAKREAERATARAALLDQQADAAIVQADIARTQQAALVARVEAAEADIAAARARIALVERLRMRQRVRLGAREQPIVRLAGALQLMARRPPALAIVQPGSLTDLVHVRALLASSLPLVQARTAGIRLEIAEGDRLRARAALALATLRAGEQQLRTRRAELARLEADHRRRSERLADSAMAEEDRAMAMGEQARDLVDLMQALDAQSDVRARLERLPAPLPRPDLPALAAAPLPAPERPDGGYRLPLRGRLLTGLGEVAESGVRARGLTFAAQPGMAVVAPAKGRIAFAGPFRGYGRIVILDHGDGWMTLVARLAELDVAVGDKVDGGDPIGRAGAGRPRVTVELRRGGQPVDIPSLVARG
ncbi:MAG: peptidase [Sphingomonas bacterium]|nr:peptidase [Sphingomonas bacterium]